MFYQNYLKSVRKCPFCSLSRAEILKENKNAVIIPAKAPYTKDHLLVVPKKHILSFKDMTLEEEKDLDKLVDFAMRKIHKKYRDVSILYREGDMKKVGKSIDHVHYHIIPNLKIGAIDINLKKRIILEDRDYLKLVEKMKRELR